MSFYSDGASALVTVSLSLLYFKFLVFELSCLCVFLLLSIDNKLRSLNDLPVTPPLSPACYTPPRGNEHGERPQHHADGEQGQVLPTTYYL